MIRWNQIQTCLEIILRKRERKRHEDQSCRFSKADSDEEMIQTGDMHAGADDLEERRGQE